MSLHAEPMGVDDVRWFVMLGWPEAEGAGVGWREYPRTWRTEDAYAWLHAATGQGIVVRPEQGGVIGGLIYEQSDHTDGRGVVLRIKKMVAMGDDPEIRKALIDALKKTMAGMKKESADLLIVVDEAELEQLPSWKEDLGFKLEKRFENYFRDTKHDGYLLRYHIGDDLHPAIQPPLSFVQRNAQNLAQGSGLLGSLMAREGMIHTAAWLREQTGLEWLVCRDNEYGKLVSVSREEELKGAQQVCFMSEDEGYADRINGTVFDHLLAPKASCDLEPAEHVARHRLLSIGLRHGMLMADDLARLDIDRVLSRLRNVREVVSGLTTFYSRDSGWMKRIDHEPDNPTTRMFP